MYLYPTFINKQYYSVIYSITSLLVHILDILTDVEIKRVQVNQDNGKKQQPQQQQHDISSVGSTPSPSKNKKRKRRRRKHKKMIILDNADSVKITPKIAGNLIELFRSEKCVGCGHSVEIPHPVFDENELSTDCIEYDNGVKVVGNVIKTIKCGETHQIKYLQQ